MSGKKRLAVWFTFGALVGLVSCARAGVIDNSETQRESGYRTGSVLMKNETTPLLMTSETRLRVNTSSAGGAWDLTLPATNFLGALWFYLGSEGVKSDTSLTLDGRGRLFAQYPTYDGEILRNGGVDAFAVNAFSYSTIVNLAGLPNENSSVESFAFSNTVMTLAARPDFSFGWAVDGGFVSFAGRNGEGRGGYLLFPNQAHDATFTWALTNAETRLPGIRLRDHYRDIDWSVVGGRFVNNGFLYWNIDGTPAYAGTTRLLVEKGAEFVQGGAFTIGQSAYRDLRTALLLVDGPGTSFRQAAALEWTGRGLLCVTNGASYIATGSTCSLGGSSAASKVDVLVSGAGSRLDLSGLSGMFSFSGNDVRFAVTDGAELDLPASATFGNDYTSVTTLEISGDDTKVRKAGAGSQVYFPTYGTATVRMTGGWFGPKDGNAFMVRLGHESGTTGSFSISGGTLDLSPSGSTLDVGLSGNATFDVSGGTVAVGGAINLGLTANNTTQARSLFRMTGGDVSCGGAVVLCAGADADRLAEVVLDGGILTCDQLRGVHSTAGGWKGRAILSANGGTLKPRQSRTDAQYPFVDRLDAVTLGARGLTLDTDGFDVIAVLNPANAADATGLFRKTGAGCLDLRFTSYAVAHTVVAGGTLRVGTAGAAAMATTLCLTNGAVLSLAGDATGLTLDGLDLADGTLSLDAGDTITVTGAARLGRLSLALSAAPDTATTNTLFVFKTPLDAASQTALRRAYCATAPAAGYHVRFAYDAETGAVTTFAEKDVEPLGAADTTVWTGTDGTGWAAPANWSAGVPTDATRAAFAENGAAKAVAVPSGAQVAALSFEGTGFALAGEAPLEVVGEQGAAEIAVSANMANAIAAPLAFDSVVGLSVAADAELTLAGAIRGGGFRKTGAGTVTLAGANDFTLAATAARGITRVTQAGALDGLAELAVSRDTLAFVAPDATVKTPVVVRAAVESEPVVFATEEDVTLTSFTVASGGFVKRGAGTLTLDACAAMAPWCLATVWGTGMNGRPASSAVTGFPADGAAPASGVAGLTVAEGEVVFRGKGKKVCHETPGVLVVGLNATNVAADAQATLTLDNVKLRNYGGKAVHLYVGYGAGLSPARQTTPTLRLLNGAELVCDTLRVGVDTAAKPEAGTHATLAMTNATVRAGAIYFSDSTSPMGSTVIRCKDSELTSSAYPIYVHGVIDAVFDNCWIGRGSQAERLTDRPVEFGLYNWNYHLPTGQVAFVNGTTLHATLVNFAQLQQGVTLLFDDAEWDYGTVTNAVARDYTFGRELASDALMMRMRGKGMTLRPKAGTTFTTEVPFVGDGGIRNLGAGTVAFASGAYGFDGTCYAGEGASFDLSDAGTQAESRFGGAGTFRGVAAQKTTLDVVATDDWRVEEVPTFDGGSLGAVLVDFGRTDETALSEDWPKDVLVARLVNGATAASFRLRGRSTGLAHVTGTFTVNAAGEVRLSVSRAGTLFIVR